MADELRPRDEATEQTVIWEPLPKQEAFLSCPADDAGYGGSRGGGKSDAVIGDWIGHEFEYGEHAIGMAFRRTTVQINELIERGKQILVPLGHCWHEQGHYFRGPKGGRLRFTYLERDADADNYQGHSYTRLYPEEIGTFPNEAPINKLFATLRSGHGVPCQMKSTCNPGGPGHNWVKARYRLSGILSKPSYYQFEFVNPFTKKKIIKTRAFIPSFVTDNKYLGDDYVANIMMSGSKNLVKAWLEGDWDIVDGAFFDGWESGKHVIRPFRIPNEWLRFRSMDWGFATPFSIGWWAVCPDSMETETFGGRSISIPRGALVRYREWYGCQEGQPNIGLRLTAEQVADGISERELSEKIAYGVIDPSAFAHQNGPSVAERMFARKVQFRKADNTRVSRDKGALGGWDMMRSRLRGDGETPMLYVFSTCRDFIRTVPTLQHDSDRPEDLDTEQEDHCFAAGTLVLTDEGPQPIEEIPPDGLIATKDGWQFYRSARLVARNQSLVRLKFSDGYEVTCTPDHKFLNHKKDWINAIDFIDETSYVSSCKSSSFPPLSKSSTAPAIISAGAISNVKGDDFISQYGNSTMGQSQWGATSITQTMIGQTTTYQTSNASLCLNTLVTDMGQQARSAGYHQSQELNMRQLLGMGQMMVASGTVNTTRSISAQSQNSGWLPFARIAARLTKWLRRTRSTGNTAATIVKPVRCVSVERLNEKQDVYCLTVPRHGNFALSNGIIVANCADECRYACLSRPWVPKPIEPEKPKELIYEVKPDGRVVANMGVRERVLMLEKKRKRDKD